MTILAELRADIQEALRRSASKTLLWLDPQREWERLLDQLAAEFELLKYDGSQLQLRASIERRPAERPRIVYVPLSRHALSVLKEYEFILPVWDEGLLHALRRWGVGIEREEEKTLLPLLPSLAARWCEKPMDYWRHLTASGVRARLFDDEQVRVFLADPDEVFAELEREGALEVFRDFLDEAFGVPRETAANPADVARRLVQNLILAEACERGGPEAFPYPDRLPQPGARERCVRFLSRWLEARTQSQTASRLIREAERDLPQLGPWAASLDAMPDVQSSLQVERVLIERVAAELRACQSVDERAALLAERLPVFHRHESHFWAVEGEVPEWEALALAGAVANGARAALEELAALRTASALVEAYVARWWRVDQAYRRYRAGFEAHPGLDEVAETVRRLHRRYLEETNKAFANALEGSQGLAATGLPEQRSFWPAGDDRRRAILVLDAFRLDLARELEARLRDAGGQTSVDLKLMRAPVPSITPLGMASLLPLDGIAVAVTDGVWSIRPAGAGGERSRPGDQGGPREAARVAPVRVCVRRSAEAAGPARPAGAQGVVAVCLFDHPG